MGEDARVAVDDFGFLWIDLSLFKILAKSKLEIRNPKTNSDFEFEDAVVSNSVENKFSEFYFVRI